jgi:hypothetical protein
MREDSACERLLAGSASGRGKKPAGKRGNQAMSGEIVRESGRNFPARSELHSHSETACRRQTQEFAALAGGMPLAALIGARAGV